MSMLRAMVIVSCLGLSAHAQPAPYPYVPPAPQPDDPPAPLPDALPTPATEPPGIEPAPEVMPTEPLPEPIVEAAPELDPALVDAWRLVKPRTIGVLLPLTGASEKLGRAAREAIELAVADSNVRVVFRDTASDPARAATQAEELITSERVTAILGPISRKECASVAAVTRRFLVPQLVLASAIPAGTTPAPDPVWRLRTSPSELARGLASHARLALGVGRVAVVYPETDAGREAASAFSAEMTRLGGRVVHDLGYTPGDGSFKTIMPELMNAKRPGKKVTADFDAVFVPDQAPTALAFVSQLAAWGVPLKRSPGAAGGRVQVLGMAGWGSSLIIDRTTALTENAVFAEAWDPAAGDATFVIRFVARLQKPPTTFHAEAFDAASLLAAAVDVAPEGEPDQALRTMVLARLMSPSTRTGATGELRIEDDHLRARVHLLTVQGTTVRERLGEDEELARRNPVPTGDAP